MRNHLLRAAAGNAGQGPSANAWDVEFASFEGSGANFFMVGDKEIQPTGLAFKSDGTKLFVTGYGFDQVHEYDLSTAWDVATASFQQSFSVGSQEAIPSDIFFRNDGGSEDGKKMYIVGYSGDKVYEYDLTTAWDISTASYSQNFSVSAQEATPKGLFFKNDGAKMYIVGATGDDVNEYDLSTAWDISTASYNQNFSVSAQETNPTGIFFRNDGSSNDGKQMYICGDSGNDVGEYSLSTAWDISTASYVQNFVFTSQESNPEGCVFKSDGSRMYMVGRRADTVFQYDLSTSWDVSTASYSYPTTDYFSVSSQELTPTGLFFKGDGSQMYIIGASGDEVNEYSLSTAWAIETASFTQTFSIATQETNPADLVFRNDGGSEDGKQMYVIGFSGDDVNEYSLSTAWDVSSASYTQNFSVSTQSTLPQGIQFKTDGTKMYVLDGSNKYIFRYSLSTAWDISTASYDGDSARLYVQTQESAPSGFCFKSDGTRLYVTGQQGRDITQYDLSTAWDVSTASFDATFPVSGLGTWPQGLFFKPDGEKFYTVDRDGDCVAAWTIT
jgi:sugar lactone lactonase YvrE